MRVLELKVIKKLYKNKKLIMKINKKKQIDENEEMEQVAMEQVAVEKVVMEEKFKKI